MSMINQIEEAILEIYLTEGKGSSAKKLAKYLEVSDSTIRRTIDKDGLSKNIGRHTEFVERFSKDYPMLGPVGVARVYVYYPTLRHLRDIINDYREERG
jgi:hypothetical protein